MRPKYKVVRVIERFNEQKKLLDSMIKRSRSERTKQRLTASQTTLDWAIQVLRAEIR
ncbi:MAG: hypothetical protein ACXV2C_00725 [Candidatus Bathyarchaeia archaeon]